MNNHTVSSVSILRSSLAAVAALPIPAAPPAHAAVHALFVDRAFVRSLRRLTRDVVDPKDLGALLDNARQLALSAASSPTSIEACKVWVRSLVRRQIDNYGWHGGLPLAPPHVTAHPAAFTPVAISDRWTAEYENALDRR